MKRLAVLAVLLGIALCLTTAQASDTYGVLWTNNNPNTVQNNAKTYYVMLDIDMPCVVTSIMTYHYFNDGALPGTITLFAESGEQWGPFQAVGVDGQGDVKNAYWIADVGEITLSPGRYAVADSDPGTWSNNALSDNNGIAELRGYTVTENPFGTAETATVSTTSDTAATGKNETDGSGPSEAYAVEVMGFRAGDPWTTDERANDPSSILGPPDYNSDADTNYLCLGTDGSIVLRFDQTIMDGDGDDILVYEIGSGVEATQVDVSSDLATWYDVGIAEGATSGVDINGKIPAGAQFAYVRITDLSGGSSEWPGADIDAVAALHPRPAAQSAASADSGLQDLIQKAESGDAEAQYTLGRSYDCGIGAPQDFELAASWYRKAAEQGHAYAQNNLGYLYESGQGVPQDYEQAVLWYQKAAVQGDDYAQCNLGYMYEYGNGVPQDYEQAAGWYRKAAEQGSAEGQYYLGYLYEYGYGVPQDTELAALWYTRAAARGNDYAQERLDSLQGN